MNVPEVLYINMWVYVLKRLVFLSIQKAKGIKRTLSGKLLNMNCIKKVRSFPVHSDME